MYLQDFFLKFSSKCSTFRCIMSGDYIPLDSNVVGQFITCSNEKDGLLYINGWKKSKVKAAFFSLFSILSLGTLYLLCRWFPKLNALLQYTQCSLATADYVLMKVSVCSCHFFLAKKISESSYCMISF